LKKVKPHDGLEVGRVSDDDAASYSTEHLCRCNCGEDGCREKVWRVGDYAKCAVCHARKGKGKT
jgi:hypothetical protein